MTPGTCRAARALLGISQIDLAERADIAVQTLRNFEGEQSVPSHNTWLKIKRTLEKAGIQFLEDDNGGPGLRLRHAEATNKRRRK